MMADAEFQFEGRAWQNLIKKVQLKWKDIEQRKTFAGIASIAGFKDIVRHFEEERGPKGKWAEWSESYQKHLSRIGRGGNFILRFSGRLWGSIQPGEGKFRTNSSGVLLFTNIEYAAAHQYGYPKRNLPARPFMWMSAKGMEDLVKQTEKWLGEVNG